MTTISHPKCTLVTQSVFVDDPVSGLRNVDSFGSILQVCAAPFSELNQLMTTVSPQAYVAYLIDAAKIYTGHGNGDRNIGERLRPEELKQAQVYVIYSLDPRYDKLAASYVEDRLISISDELGVPLANGNQPFGRNGLYTAPTSNSWWFMPSSCWQPPGSGVSRRRGRPLRIAQRAWPQPLTCTTCA